MWQVINGNNVEILKKYDDNTFDSIVTDPPYGIEFLGKDWDKNTGALETWQECYRVLKPGGHLLAFSAARTYHNLATNIEMSGFEIRDQLMWIYGSGFPKAQDIGKALDKREGKQDPNYGTDKTSAGVPLEGEYKGGQRCNVCNKTIGTWVKDCQEPDCGQKYNYQSEQAQQWAGWKTALKPAHEPVVMARKPFSGSTVDNVLEHGVGALNIDASRIAYAENDDERIGKGYEHQASAQVMPGQCKKGLGHQQSLYPSNEGRYPSNVIGEITDYQKYYYCPKISRTERHVGFEKLPDETKGNNHPTVKPVELMKYLVRLVTPAGGHVLDPFNGSGSTGMACVELKYDYTGIELDKDYVVIATKRIAGWEKKFDTPAYNLFDID